MPKKCCAFRTRGGWYVYRRAMGFRWPRRTSREFGSSVHMPGGFLSPRHPPSTRALARSRHRDERQGQHSTRRTLMMPRNGIICERVRAPAEHAIRRRPVLRERAAGVRLRLRLRHRSCSTTWSFEARLHEVRVTIQVSENRAVPRALASASARWPASLS